jgi:alkaline phosphatase D
MKKWISTAFFWVQLFVLSAQTVISEGHQLPLPSRICFGSCGHQDRPQPVLRMAAAQRPDFFVFLGDNIYGDTDNMETLRKKYRKWGKNSDFRAIEGRCPLLATWDDHDYGRNDAGRHYPFKELSKEIFLDYFQVPVGDVRRQRPGVFTSYIGEGNGRRIQIILLDMRTFRDDLRPYRNQPVDRTAYGYKLDYWPHENPDSTLMGAEQWAWLEQQLRQPADLRIIASSTQFGVTWNGYEAWANFPHEQERFFELVRRTRANGVLFISGDVHYAEISRIHPEGLYPIYDVTSSGITSTWSFAAPNLNRVDGPVMENHFGQIDIDWTADDPQIVLSVFDVMGIRRISRSIGLSELAMPR